MQSFKSYFLTERLSVAQSIVVDLESLIKDKESMREAKLAVEKYIFDVHGFQLGKGAFARVYGGPDGGFVVKVSYDDDKFREFAKQTVKYDNPILPNIVAHKTVDYTNDFGPYGIDLYVMAKLKVDRSTNANVVMELWDIEGLPSKTNFVSLIPLMIQDKIEPEVGHQVDAFLRKYNRTYDQLYDFGQILYDVTGNYTNDVHTGNFGFDSDGGLVIFDPLS